MSGEQQPTADEMTAALLRSHTAVFAAARLSLAGMTAEARAAWVRALAEAGGWCPRCWVATMGWRCYCGRDE